MSPLWSRSVQDSERLESLRSQSENYLATLQADMTKYNQLRSEAQEQEDSLNAEIEAELKRLAEEERRRAEATTAAPITRAPETTPSGGDETKPTPTPTPDPSGAPEYDLADRRSLPCQYDVPVSASRRVSS